MKFIDNALKTVVVASIASFGAIGMVGGAEAFANSGALASLTKPPCRATGNNEELLAMGEFRLETTIQRFTKDGCKEGQIRRVARRIE